MTNQEAIASLKTLCDICNLFPRCVHEKPECVQAIKLAISALNAQPEPSIPISWIEKQIDWLKSMGNEFSNITAMNISVLVKKWRKENGKDERSD